MQFSYDENKSKLYNIDLKIPKLQTKLDLWKAIKKLNTVRIMRKTTANERRGERLNLITILDDLEFADDIALLSSKFNDLRVKSGRLTEEAPRVDNKLNARNCKTPRTEFARNRENIVVNCEEVEDVEEFACLGAIVDKEGGGSKDVRNRLQKARGAFQKLWKVWAARKKGRRTKIRLLKSSVRPVLLYGCWL